MKTAFIIVIFKTPLKEIKRLVREINNLKIDEARIFLIDNSKSNLGYAAGANIGLKKAQLWGADLFVILNQDISFDQISENDILTIAAKFDLSGFAMQQGQKRYYRGMFEPKRLSTILETKKPEQRFADTDYITGSLMILTRKVLETVGYLDEKYGMYYEDADYGLRVKRAGLTVGIDSEKFYLHFENSTGNKNKDKYLTKNRWRFLWRHGSLFQKIYEVIRLPKTLFEKRGSYFFNFLSLNSSSLLNKIFQFGLFLILIRTLSPGEYGVYILVWAQVNILSPLLDLGTTAYGMIYLTTKSEERYSILFQLRFILAAVIFFLTIVFSFFFKDKTLVQLIFFASFIFFSNAFSGSYLLLNSVKERLYRSSFLSTVFNLVFVLVCAAVLLLTKSLYLLFFYSYIMYVLYSIINLLLLKREIKKSMITFPEKLIEWKKIIYKSSIFVLISFFAGLYTKVDVFLLTHFKGVADVGIYSSGYKFFEAFMFIAASYNITSTPVFAKMLKAGKSHLLRRMRKDFEYLLLIGVLVALAVIIILPIILPYLFKQSYLAAIPVSRIVILSLPFVLLTSIFFNALYVLKKAHWVLYLFIFQSSVNIILNYIYIPRYSYVASAWITVLCEVLNTVLALLIFRYFFRRLKR